MKELREAKSKDPKWVAANNATRLLRIRSKQVITCRACKQQTADVSSQAGNICRSCYKAYLADWQKRNREHVAEQRAIRYRTVYHKDPDWVAANNLRSRESHRLLRHEAIMAYGGYKCECCGETEPRFMTLDHVFDNGAEHRRSVGTQKSRRVAIWRWLKINGYPEGYQVLCMNCNAGREWNGGVCPHKTAQKTPREFRENPVWAILSEAA